jgi:uncharacterized protein (TIGR02118 family)
LLINSGPVKINRFKLINKGKQKMIRVAVLYPRSEGKHFNVEYYIDKHMALVKAKLEPFGLQAVEVDAEINEKNSPFLAIGYILFNSLQEFEAGFAEVGNELQADIANYTNSAPVIQISEYHKII